MGDKYVEFLDAAYQLAKEHDLRISGFGFRENSYDNEKKCSIKEMMTLNIKGDDE